MSTFERWDKKISNWTWLHCKPAYDAMIQNYKQLLIKLWTEQPFL